MQALVLVEDRIKLITFKLKLFTSSLLPYPNPNISLQPSWEEGPSAFLAEQLDQQKPKKEGLVVTRNSCT